MWELSANLPVTHDPYLTHDPHPILARSCLTLGVGAVAPRL